MLRIKNLESGYGRLKVLRKISMHVGDGEIVTIIGANGAGKTTLLRTVSGLIPARSGEILFDNKKIGELPPEKIVVLGCSLVPEGRQLFAPMTVKENILLGAYPQYRRKRGDQVWDDLERVYGIFPRLRERERQLAGTLSGGEQQMLAIGRALMARPRLIMMDEPSMGLAPLVVKDIFSIVERLRGGRQHRAARRAEREGRAGHRGPRLRARDRKDYPARDGGRPPLEPRGAAGLPGPGSGRGRNDVTDRRAGCTGNRTRSAWTGRNSSSCSSSGCSPRSTACTRTSRSTGRSSTSLGINPEDIRSLADLARLPFTTKADLRDNYPYGLFAVPLRDVVRIHASSGTTGAVTVVGYTRNDIRTWSNLVARILTAGGVTKDDVVQIAFGYGLFTGAFGLHYGAERIGASVIPASSGNTERQIQIMQDFKTTALVCTPSYALLVGDTMQEMGIPVSALSLRYGLFGAEPWSESMRQEIEGRLGIVATDNYGLSEVIGPGSRASARSGRGSTSTRTTSSSR